MPRLASKGNWRELSQKAGTIFSIVFWCAHALHEVSLIIEIPGRRGERPLCSNQIFRGAKVSANVGLSKRVILQDLNFTQEVELNSSFRNANSKPRGLRGVKHSLCLWSFRHNSQFGPWLRRVHWILHKRVCNPRRWLQAFKKLPRARAQIGGCRLTKIRWHRSTRFRGEN